MPNAKKPPKTNAAQDDQEQPKRIAANTKLRWVNPFLGNDDKRWLQDHMHDRMELILELVEHSAGMGTLSVKLEDKSGRFLASLVCTLADHPGAGCAISVRGATASHALFALAYLVAKAPDSQWWLDVTDGTEDPWG